MAIRIDPWGRRLVGADDIQELIMAGTPLNDVFASDEPAVALLNRMLEERGKTQFVIPAADPLPHSPEQEHANRANTWLIGDELEGVDLREFVLSLCSTEAEIARVEEEMDLYESKGLEMVLRIMICLVDHFRRNGIVWGVGRGSSVASYVLYLLGVHKIDSIKYGLSIHDFLK